TTQARLGGRPGAPPRRPLFDARQETPGTMGSGGPFTGGENPEDPEGAGDEAGASQRGWLSPEDRLWRHPSEVSGLGLPRPVSPYLTSGAARRQRRRARRAALAAGV